MPTKKMWRRCLSLSAFISSSEAVNKRTFYYPKRKKNEDFLYTDIIFYVSLTNNQVINPKKKKKKFCPITKIEIHLRMCVVCQ